MIFKRYFRRKNRRKNGGFTQNKAILFKNLIITMVFDKTPIFFAENCQKFCQSRRPRARARNFACHDSNASGILQIYNSTL
jgi:hypothetical protein